MVFWAGVEEVAPELAAAVRGRFDAYGLGLLATLRRDGSPRISGIEPLFAMGELWLGMMPDSRKALDLRRDGRFALHSATTDKQVTSGDARIVDFVRRSPSTPATHRPRVRSSFFALMCTRYR